LMRPTGLYSFSWAGSPPASAVPKFKNFLTNHRRISDDIPSCSQNNSKVWINARSDAAHIWATTYEMQNNEPNWKPNLSLCIFAWNCTSRILQHGHDYGRLDSTLV
jgi:hypothetical protein